MKFRLLTWNIDGLDTKNTVDRAQAVCCFVKAKLPHAVYLQEVVPPTWAEIVRELSPTYDCYSPERPAGYYVAILIHKSTVKTLGGAQTVHFGSSQMGRSLLQLPVSFAGAKILLLTSHLESTKDRTCSEARRRQLRTTFDLVRTACAQDPDLSCVFGGDLNLRDAEVKEVGLPGGMVDVWEARGAPRSEKFTWDLKTNDNLDWPHPNKPSCRFDRVYLMSGERGGLSVPSSSSSREEGEGQGEGFVLVGKARLRKCGGRFPSDHWGIWTEFEVRYQ